MKDMDAREGNARHARKWGKYKMHEREHLPWAQDASPGPRTGCAELYTQSSTQGEVERRTTTTTRRRRRANRRSRWVLAEWLTRWLYTPCSVEGIERGRATSFSRHKNPRSRTHRAVSLCGVLRRQTHFLNSKWFPVWVLYLCLFDACYITKAYEHPLSDSIPAVCPKCAIFTFTSFPPRTLFPFIRYVISK